MTGRIVDEGKSTRRRHASGEATRVLLLEAAERLFAVRGIDSVALREIQVAAGQSNSSVIGYHFGSKTGLVQALIAHRQPALDVDRERALAVMEEREPGPEHARELVRMVVGPMVASIERGELYVPFLARLAEDPQARSAYWPEGVDDSVTAAMTESLVDAAMGDLPARIKHSRSFMFFTAALNTLGEHARTGWALSPARLSGYVDGWAGMLTAPVSTETAKLLAD